MGRWERYVGEELRSMSWQSTGLTTHTYMTTGGHQEEEHLLIWLSMKTRTTRTGQGSHVDDMKRWERYIREVLSSTFWHSTDFIMTHTYMTTGRGIWRTVLHNDNSQRRRKRWEDKSSVDMNYNWYGKVTNPFFFSSLPFIETRLEATKDPSLHLLECDHCEGEGSRPWPIKKLTSVWECVWDWNWEGIRE